MIYQPGMSVMAPLIARAVVVTGITRRELTGNGREKAVCHVRFAVMLLARMKGLSLPQIARALGDRDHTTILHGVKRARGLCDDPDFAAMLRDLQA